LILRSSGGYSTIILAARGAHNPKKGRKGLIFGTRLYFYYNTEKNGLQGKESGDFRSVVSFFIYYRESESCRQATKQAESVAKAYRSPSKNGDFQQRLDGGGARVV
jgi:hypothetical protein